MLILQLAQLVYYNGQPENSSWKYSNSTAYLTKERLTSITDDKLLKVDLYTRFFKNPLRPDTRFISLRFFNWEKVKKFLDDFEIKPEQITLASWLYAQKSVYIAFYVDENCSLAWYDTLRRTLQYINCNTINDYGEVNAVTEVMIPSALSDRHLDPKTLIVTDDLSMVVKHAKNSINHPVSKNKFVEKLSQKRKEAEKYINNRTSYTNLLSEIDVNYVKDTLAIKCIDPRCLYSENKEPRIEWLEGITNILLEIYALILYKKTTDDKLTMTLQEFYYYRHKYNFFTCLNTIKLRDVIIKILLESRIISRWDLSNETMFITPKDASLF